MYKGNQSDEGTDNPRHGSAKSQQRLGIGRSFWPGVPWPETVLVAVMSDGGYFLVGYPRGEPTAFVVREEAELLKQALAGAFENLREAACRNSSAAREHEPLRTEQAPP